MQCMVTKGQHDYRFDILYVLLWLNDGRLPIYFRNGTGKIDHILWNKANLRDLIAATGLVLFLKFDLSHRFSACVTLKFDGWPHNKIGHLLYTTSSFVHHFKSICEFKRKLQSGNARFGSKLAIFCPVWPWNLRMTLENNREPLVYYIKLCA